MSEMEKILSNIGNNIRKSRRGKKWSQRQLSEKADLDRTYISNLENGKQNMTVGALHKLATALDINLQLVFNGE